MTERKKMDAPASRQSLVCVEAGLGVAEGRLFPVITETGSVWEIVLGGEYRKVNKRSCRVQGWKSGPRFDVKMSWNDF
ncbi:hypothetical protein D3C80_570470 [compost metagenome]